MLDENLIHAIIGGEDADCGLVELRMNLRLTRGHGSLLLDQWYVWIARRPGGFFGGMFLFRVLLPETQAIAAEVRGKRERE